MDSPTTQADWDQLQAILDSGQTELLSEFLLPWSFEDTSLALSRMDEDHRRRFLESLEPERAADLLACMSNAQAVSLVGELEAGSAASIVQEMTSSVQADVIGELPVHQAEAILDALSPEDANSLRQLALYGDNEAGGLMITEFLAYPERWNVRQVVEDLRRNADQYRDLLVQYAFVVNSEGGLLGVLRLRDLLLANDETVVSKLMIANPLTVGDHTSLDDLRQFFDDHDFLGVPVVDGQQNLMGLVTREAVEEALAERYEDDYRKSQGLVQEELRSMPLWLRSRRRLAWLSINILLNLFAAGVIAMYQDILQQVIALAVFLPIISDMSGCTGNQAVAVSMRELSLGLVRPTELMRVFLKEAAVGLINGTILGLLIAILAFVYQKNVWLGAVVGSALALNSLIAVVLGGMLPLAMKRINMDPALASGPILTTVTDMCGFFIVLSLASMVLPYLI